MIETNGSIVATPTLIQTFQDIIGRDYVFVDEHNRHKRLKGKAKIKKSSWHAISRYLTFLSLFLYSYACL